MQDKILFLDIDGVLNTHQSCYFFRKILKRDENAFDPEKQYVLNWLSEEFCPIATSNLNRIVEDTGCKIVVSSTWRLGEELETMKGWFKNFPTIQEAIIGKTPVLKVKYAEQVHNCPRGMEIDAWLDEHKIRTWDSYQFAVLDDDSDMWPINKKNFFLCDAHVGLDYNLMMKVIKFLKGNNEVAGSTVAI